MPVTLVPVLASGQNPVVGHRIDLNRVIAFASQRGTGKDVIHLRGVVGILDAAPAKPLDQVEGQLDVVRREGEVEGLRLLPKRNVPDGALVRELRVIFLRQRAQRLANEVPNPALAVPGECLREPE
jgi:hypothetical protein